MCVTCYLAQRIWFLTVTATLLQLLVFGGWMAGLDLRQNKPSLFLEDVSMTMHIVLKVACILIHGSSWHIFAVKVCGFLAMVCDSILVDIWGIAHLRSFTNRSVS
jgi:hypothetical protein